MTARRSNAYGTVRLCVKCRQQHDVTTVVCPHDGSRTLELTPSDDPRVGSTIDSRFTLLGVLGSGGAGTVYRALQHSMEREVAVKLIKRERTANTDAIQRFLREAKSACQIVDPHVITLFDFGQTEEGELFLVMELLRGRPLRQIIEEETTLEPERAVALTAQVCDGLTAAHKQGVIHRDLKPENVFVLGSTDQRDEFVKVIDFGVAKTLAEPTEEGLTPTGIILGTPYAMSPEQARGFEVDPRTDVYAIGVMLYEMLSGVQPFERETELDIVLAHVRDEAPPLSSHRSGIPPALEALVHRALSKKPEERPTDAVEMKKLLLDSIERRVIPPRPSVPLIIGPTNLANPTTSFVGRTRDLSKIQWIFAHGHRLVLLHGPDGMGKSRLALEYGLARLNETRRLGAESALGEASVSGAWRCDLSDALTEDMVCQAVAAALGLWLQNKKRDPAESIGRALAGMKRVLLILDDVEWGMEVVGPLLEKWLQMAPQLRILVTSRQTLGVEGEVVYEVGPLELPPESYQDDSSADDTVVEGAFETSEAVRLFIERAVDVNPDLMVDDHETNAIQELVRRLDGMPLAIELAAARVSVFKPSQMIARLEQRFELLSAEAGDASQRPLHQTIEWSWSLLNDAEQDTLAQLSVFRGGFSVEAVERVVDLSTLAERPWVVDVLQSLRDKSFVRALESTEIPGEVRFSLYESIRDFANDRLQELGIAQQVEARHATFYLWICGEWSDAVRENGDEWMRRRLSQDFDNVISVYHRAMSEVPASADTVERALLALLVAEPVVRWKGPVGVYLRWLESAVDSASWVGVRPELVERANVVRGDMVALRNVGDWTQ